MRQNVRPCRASACALLFALSLPPVPRPDVSPRSRGFETITIEAEVGPLDVYLSTHGEPLQRERQLPLVVFLQGSGATPIFFGSASRPGSSLMLDPDDFPDAHFAVIGKPGVGFHASLQRVDSPEYDRKLSLEYRIAAASAAVETLAAEPFVDPQRVVLVGHSEGADVAPWVAARTRRVTHLVVLAPGGLSQMVELSLLAQRQLWRGEGSNRSACERYRCSGRGGARCR